MNEIYVNEDAQRAREVKPRRAHFHIPVTISHGDELAEELGPCKDSTTAELMG